MTPQTAPSDALQWWEAGEKYFDTAAERLTDGDVDGPSRLEGWSRRTVLAHVAANADALVNLLTWARTGVETPMYASAEARAAGIAAKSALAPNDLRVATAHASARFAAAVALMEPATWDIPVRTAQGRTVPASQVPWMRCREVWVHAIDLDAGADFSDLPDPLLAALVQDVVSTWARRGETPNVSLNSGDMSWTGGSVRVDADLPLLASYVTGRRRPATQNAGRQFPELPSWL